MKKELRLFDLRVKVSSAERARLQAYADREHLHISTAVRRAALIAADNSEPTEDLEAAKEA